MCRAPRYGGGPHRLIHASYEQDRIIEFSRYEHPQQSAMNVGTGFFTVEQKDECFQYMRKEAAHGRNQRL